MFFFLRSCFLILENRSQTKIWIFIRTFSGTIILRIVVEYVKVKVVLRALGLLSTGQWLSIPFIIIGLYFIFTAEKPVKI
jgi:prolipoprotein diacylglyceryltransferase